MYEIKIYNGNNLYDFLALAKKGKICKIDSDIIQLHYLIQGYLAGNPNYQLSDNQKSWLDFIAFIFNKYEIECSIDLFPYIVYKDIKDPYITFYKDFKLFCVTNQIDW